METYVTEVVSRQRERTVRGVVTQVTGSQVFFKLRSAVVHAGELSRAILVRRHGSPMQLSEIAVGDKLEVRGQAWPDGSMTVSRVRNLSLYAHSGTFKGKIVALDSVTRSLSIQSGEHGPQTIHTDALTVFMKNGSNTTFQDLAVGMVAQVRGVWERSRAQVHAKIVVAKVRLVTVDITGQVVMKLPEALTVTVNNVIYAVDIRTAQLLSKRGKPITVGDLPMGVPVRIRGKHIAESNQVVAIVVKEAK